MLTQRAQARGAGGGADAARRARASTGRDAAQGGVGGGRKDKRKPPPTRVWGRGRGWRLTEYGGGAPTTKKETPPAHV